MREHFRQWMVRVADYAQGTVNGYISAINSLSEHYSETIGNAIDIFEIRDRLRLIAISTDYGIGGRYQDIGRTGHATYRNAIAAYVRFFNQEGRHLIENDGENVIENNIENPEPVEQVNEINNFTYERDLKNSLVRQTQDLFPGYRIYGENGEGIEYPIDGRRIDLLLENIEENTLLVIELKAGIAGDRVFAQISWYLGSLIQRFPEKTIKGIIIAGEIDDSLVRACAITDRIKLMQYNMNILLEEI